MKAIDWNGAFARAMAALTLAAGLAACDGDDGSYAPSQKMTLAAKTDNSYGVVTASSGATIEMFRGSTGAVTQSLYINLQTGEKVRVFNATDGTPDRVLDERSGNTLTITRTSSERVDYRAYDAGGAYLGGYALLSRADGFHVAPVIGTPSFSGQLTAQMNGSTQTGSFALLPAADAGLGTAVQVSAAALAFADSGLRTGAAAPGVAQALAAPGGAQALASALAASAIDRRAVIGGLAAGALLANGGWAPALIGGGMMAFGLQNDLLPVLDAVRDASSLEQLPDTLNTFLDRFDTGVSGTLALNDALAGVTASRTRAAVKRAFDVLRDIVSALIDRATLRALTATAPLGDTGVTGEGVDQGGTRYTLAGTVSAAGSLTATATPADNGTKVLINGNITGTAVSGTVSGRLGNGTLTGSVAQLGQCAVLQQSGGQGTTTYVFDAGVAAGTFEFYRNAYSIPDGFRVISNGQTLYDSGGLVSGTETKTLSLAGSRSVFVTVNAPNTGTAWDIRVGCPV